MKAGLSRAEKEVLALLAKASNAYFALPEEHPVEKDEWLLSVHRLQDLMERLESIEELLPGSQDIEIDESLVLDLSGVDAGLVHDGLLDGSEQLGRMQSRQPAVALPDRAARGLDDDRITHAARLEHVSVL